eukprot:TRINITY_DN38673_c0_g1_i1.p1 TRINITY_DN38673_c0_g1~~TRINITY_DN38673_c0_g1_i1.p1  ORF type:complete len:705 (+),score=151.32 TRINITY_DN38673_c0_g1_i1:68-2182(+)
MNVRALVWPEHAFIPLELQRKWLDQRGVKEKHVLFFHEFLQQVQSLGGRLLGVVEAISYLRDWWLDVQAEQRYRQRNPRQWLLSSLSLTSTQCFSGFAMLCPWLFPRWFFDMRDVEMRIDLLEEMHTEVCRYLGFTHHRVYRLLQWRAQDPSGLAGEAKKLCEKQLRLQSLFLTDLSTRLSASRATRRVQGQTLLRKQSATMLDKTVTMTPQASRPMGSMATSPSLRNMLAGGSSTESIHDVATLKVAMADLEEVINRTLWDLRKAGHLSRWRGLYTVMSLVLLITACRNPLPPQAILAECSRQVWTFLRQFFHEWLTEPLDILREQLFMTTEQAPIVSVTDLAHEREVLDKMHRDFYRLLGKPITAPEEKLIKEEDISLAVDYYKNALEEPLYGVMRGFLVGSSMVQAQKCKVVMYDLAHSIELMMADVRLNVAVSSIFPISTLVYMLYSWAGWRSYRRQVLWIRRCNQALDSVDRVLSDLGVAEAPLADDWPMRKVSIESCTSTGTPRREASTGVPGTPTEISGWERLRQAIQTSTIGQVLGVDVEATGEAPAGEDGDAFNVSEAGDHSATVHGSLSCKGRTQGTLAEFQRNYESHLLNQDQAEALTRMESAQSAAALTEVPDPLERGSLDPAWEKSGLLLSNLCLLSTTCVTGPYGLSAREVRFFSQDISSLSSPDLTIGQKLRIVGRMRFSYSCFQIPAI